MSRWQRCDQEGHLLVHMDSGVYFGCSQSCTARRDTRGRLFTTTLVYGKPAEYHCIAWSEL